MKPCCQCGRCCQAEVCKIGKDLFQVDKPPCPALIYENNKYWCGLIKYGDDLVLEGGIKTSKTLSLMLGIGYGCDSTYGTTE